MAKLNSASPFRPKMYPPISCDRFLTTMQSNSLVTPLNRNFIRTCLVMSSLVLLVVSILVNLVKSILVNLVNLAVASSEVGDE